MQSNKRDSGFLASSRTFALIAVMALGLGFAPKGFSQTTSYNDIETATYRQYLNQSWDSLIVAGKLALDHKIDYYYLRLRMGIAYFNKKNYRLAIRHLEKAEKLNAFDDVLKEYLYLAYTFSNQSLKAYNVYAKSSGALQEKLRSSKPPPVDYIGLGYGRIFTDNFSKYENDSLAGADSLFAVRELIGGKTYTDIGLSGKALKRFSWYLGGTFLETEKLYQATTADVIKTGYDTILYNGWYYVDTVYGLNYNGFEEKFKIRQYGLYGSFSVLLGNGFKVTPAIHWLRAEASRKRVIATPVEYFAQSYDTIPSLFYDFAIQPLSLDETDLIYALSVDKSLGSFDFRISGVYANLTNFEQYQTRASAVFYPYGNLNLYIKSVLTATWEEDENNLIYEAGLGFKATKFAWLEWEASFGDRRNFVTNNGYSVFNAGDQLVFQGIFKTYFLLSKTIGFNLSYHYSKYNPFEPMIVSEGENQRKKQSEKSYLNHFILGEISWKL